MNNIKVCTCTIVRLENNYLIEFVEHYKKIGIDHMFIYDNNIPYTENVIDVLQPYVDENFVTIIDYTDQQKYPMGNAIASAFTECWEKNNNEYDWILYLDNDEFLELKHDNNIKEYLSRNCFNNVDVIRINWLCYDDNNMIYYENKPLKERFTHPCKGNPYLFKENKHTKSIVHNIAKNKIIYFFPNVCAHGPKIFKNNKLVVSDCAGNILENENFGQSSIKTINFDYAYYAHYRMKTIDEYVHNKIEKLNNQNYTNIGFTSYKFFEYNDYSEEKEKIYIDYIKNQKSNVVYTYVFGKSELHDPKYVTKGWDYICFTDNMNLKSSVWNIQYINLSLYKHTNPNLDIMLFPNIYVKKYQFSIYVNNKIIINADLNYVKENYIDTLGSYNYLIYCVKGNNITDIICRYNFDQNCKQIISKIFKENKLSNNVNDKIITEFGEHIKFLDKNIFINNES